MIKIDSEIEGGFSNVWVTSDTHYGHKNICRGVTDWRLPDGRVPVDNTRNFQTIEQMNDAIVNNINNVVSQNDVLIHLGDWSFGGFENIKKFYDRLVCKNIHLILGNHDESIEKNKDSTQELFLTVSHYETLVIGKRKLRLMHYPISSWDGLSKGVIHLHGHLHSPTQNRMGVGRKFDVGIDGHPDFRPYHLTKELIPMLEKRPIESEVKFDHHLDGMKNVVG